MELLCSFRFTISRMPCPWASVEFISKIENVSYGFFLHMHFLAFACWSQTVYWMSCLHHWYWEERGVVYKLWWMKCLILMMFSFLYFGVFSPNIQTVSQHYPLVSPVCTFPSLRRVPGRAIHLSLPHRTLLRTAARPRRRSRCHGQRRHRWATRRTPNWERTEGQSQYILVR